MTSSAVVTFLVSGATGNQGGSVVRELLKAGHRIHVLVRDPSKPQAKELESLGAVLFVGDYDNAEAIRKATVGVKGVFINPYPVFTDPNGEAKQVQLFVDAASAAGTVEALVISTVFNAGKHVEWARAHPDHLLASFYLSKFAAEEVVRASGVKYWTVLRPPWLFQNFILPQSNTLFPELHTERVARTPLDLDISVAQLDARDVGRWVAAAFADPARFNGKTLELVAQNLTVRESLRQMSVAAGFDIPTPYVSLDELEKDTSNPMSFVRAAVTRFHNERGFDLALAQEELDDLKSYGIPLTTLREYFEKNKAKVLETLSKTAA